MYLCAASSQEWMLLADCRIKGSPDDWYADRCENPGSYLTAKEICRGCPVQVFCLEFAQKTREPLGIWGGYDPDERYDMRRHALRVNARRRISV